MKCEIVGLQVLALRLTMIGIKIIGWGVL